MRQSPPPKPSRSELLAAADRTLPDILAPGLDVVFCGINPGLYSAWSGHHFARPGSRFWPALHRSGFTPREFPPAQQEELLDLRLGLTNIVARASAAAAELTAAELRAGARALEVKMRGHAPAWLAILGVTAFRTAFDRPDATYGPQDLMLGQTRVWVIPNPSGLNAHFTPPRLAAAFADLRNAVGRA